MIENGGFKSCIKCKTPKSVEFFYKSTPLRKNDDGTPASIKAVPTQASMRAMRTSEYFASTPA